jgi:hypothetical protein
MLASAGIMGLMRQALLNGEAVAEAVPQQTVIVGPTADERLAGFQPGQYPAGAGSDEVAAGGATLTINQGGQGVSSLQSRLNQLGATPPLAVDGKLGPLSFGALRDAQRQLGLPETGVLDRTTLAAIDAAIASGKSLSISGSGGAGGGAPGAGATAPGGTGAPTGTTPAPPPGLPGPGGPGGLPFEPNPAALEVARNSPLGGMIADKTRQFAPIYERAAEATGVPKAMIAAIHFNESHQSQGVGPESGYGLDPRHVKTGYGNTILGKYGIEGPWQRGGTTPLAQLQSAVIAAHTLKDNAEYLGITMGPNMTRNELAAVITAYGAGAGSPAPKTALATGKSFMFDPGDSQPHVRHPGGSSIDRNGNTVRVAPGVKKGLLRWDVVLPLMGEQLGGTGMGHPPIGPGGMVDPPTPGALPDDGHPTIGPGGGGVPDDGHPTIGPGGMTGPGAPMGLPPRPAGAPTGSQFIESTKGKSRPEREAMILAEIERGNVPDFVRQLKPVTVTANGADGRPHQITFYTMPDYLAIGTNEDFMRVPMDPLTAQKIADKRGMSLPTRTMVDAVYGQASVKLAPSPMTPGPQMMSSDYYQRHQATIERQRAGQPLGALTAGHKKDLVLTNRLLQKPGSVAIYGWHQRSGQPIQPRSTVHENTYADYSHGARLVGGMVMVDGQPRRLQDVLTDPNLAKVLSDEGPLRVTRQPGVPV